MANVSSEEKRHQVLALGRLGWSVRRIGDERGVRRQTASAYLEAAGIDVRGPRRRRMGPSTDEAKPASEGPTDLVAAKPASEVPTDPVAAKPASEVPTDSRELERPGRS